MISGKRANETRQDQAGHRRQIRGSVAMRSVRERLGRQRGERRYGSKRNTSADKRRSGSDRRAPNLPGSNRGRRERRTWVRGVRRRLGRQQKPSGCRWRKGSGGRTIRDASKRIKVGERRTAQSGELQTSGDGKSKMASCVGNRRRRRRRGQHGGTLQGSRHHLREAHLIVRRTQMRPRTMRRSHCLLHNRRGRRLPRSSRRSAIHMARAALSPSCRSKARTSTTTTRPRMLRVSSGNRPLGCSGMIKLRRADRLSQGMFVYRYYASDT